eukprot:jgi/Tetstr1/460362/TSEL_005661.t1
MRLRGKLEHTGVHCRIRCTAGLLTGLAGDSSTQADRSYRSAMAAESTPQHQEIIAGNAGTWENSDYQGLIAAGSGDEIQGHAEHDQEKALLSSDRHSPLRPSTPDGLDQPSEKTYHNDISSADVSRDLQQGASYRPPLLLKIYMDFTLLCLRLVSSKTFQNFITVVIMLASLMVGMQTYPSLEDNPVLNAADRAILAIFTLECVLKVLAVGLRPWEYVYDSDGVNFWNVFDFVVVLVCYLPLDASMVTVIRLFRLLRVLKLVRALPELQILVMGLIGSIPSIFYVALLLCLVFYLYGIMCLSFFKPNDPVNFWDLQTTFLTLFRMSTLDDWVDIMYTAMYGNDIVPCDPWRGDRCTEPTPQPWLASLFFVSFAVLSAFVVLNLFIGVVATQMEEAKGRLQKENDNRGNMSGCEDEFDEEERMAKLISLRFDDLSAEAGSIVSEIIKITKALEQLERRRKERHSHASTGAASAVRRSQTSSTCLSGDSVRLPNADGRAQSVTGTADARSPPRNPVGANTPAAESQLGPGGSGSSTPAFIGQLRRGPGAAPLEGQEPQSRAGHKNEEQFVKEVTQLQAKLQQLHDMVPGPVAESAVAAPGFVPSPNSS